MIVRWWRARRAAGVRALMLRGEAEARLDLAQQFAAQAEALFAAADRAPHLSAKQFRLTFDAYALDCDAKALTWAAGGDEDAAAEYRIAASDWRARAAQFIGAEASNA